ncbi:calcium binding protein [Acrasis kona]|uniref:Calcium binding protein n=1 Tax=Acrasis kona TaxID=1008807 RepID=A0AAW2ZB78_9EUKA
MSSLKRIFGKRTTPKDLVSQSCDLIGTIVSVDNTSPKYLKAVEDLYKKILELKSILLGEVESETKKSDAELIAKEAICSGLIMMIVRNFERIGSDSQRDSTHIFNNLLKLVVVEYIEANPSILDLFIEGLEKHDIAQMYCQMLVESIKHAPLAQMVLPRAYQMFKLAEEVNFEVSSNAFLVVREILTRHKTLVANFMDTNFDVFFEKYSIMMKSNNYMTRRQSIKLLSELLLDRSNLLVMKRFINKKENMQIIMNALIDRYKNIQFEAFHVFKLFIANPNKDDQIKNVIRANRNKLLQFLRTFQEDRLDDQQFVEEKELLMTKISELE